MNFYKFFFLLSLVFIVRKAECQREVYLPNAPYIGEMVIHENFLYTEISDSQENIWNIVRYDLTDENPTSSIIYSSNEIIGDLAINGNSLYFNTVTQSNETQYQSSIQVIDLLNLDNDPEIILESEFIPLNIKIHQNKMYISGTDKSTEFDIDLQSLLVYQLDSLEQGPIIIADSLNIVDLDIYDSKLIFYEGDNESNIFTYETEVEFLVKVFGAFNEIAIRDNELYLPNNTLTQDGTITGQILKIDLDKLEYEAIVVSDEVCGPVNIEVHNNFLYVFESGIPPFCPRQISKINLDDEITSTIQIHEENNLIVYPNPSADFLYVQDKEPCTYNIFSLDGKHILSGELGIDKKININDIPTGLFYISFKDGSTAKFQKINSN